MEKHNFVGKSLEDAINQAKIKLQDTEDNLIINELTTKKGIFTTKVEIEVIEKRELINFIKEYLKTILKQMGYTVKIEIFNKKEVPVYQIYSNNDSLLIGKNGKNLKALHTILSQVILKEINKPFKFVLDVNNYQEQKERNIIRLAKNIANEVAVTKVETKLDSMNSYERRIVHNALSNNKRVYTESTGEEPNRCVIIKPRED